jgi:hypothetical protein
MGPEIKPLDLDVILGRKWVKVAEWWIGGREDGQCSARWFQDTESGRWFVAESWKRPNLRRPLNAEQSAYVETLLKVSADAGTLVAR